MCYLEGAGGSKGGQYDKNTLFVCIKFSQNKKVIFKRVDE